MPDLRTEAIHAFWDSYDRRTLYRVIVALENVEHWRIDSDADIEPGIVALGEAIDAASDFDLDERTMVSILANTGATRALRILQSLDIAKPGTASQLLMYAEEAGGEGGNDKHAQLFLKRNLVFERLQLLSRVFSPQRISLVLRALESRNE